MPRHGAPVRARTLEVRLLGGFRVLVDGVPVDVAARGMAARVLAYLALHGSTERGHLAGLLWPDGSEERARANLRKALLTLRAALPPVVAFLEFGHRTLSWRAGATPEVDAVRFREAVLAGTGPALAAALELYGGELLPGWADEWVLAERERLHLLYLEALERLADLREAERAYDAAQALAERLRAEDPLNEEHVRRLLRLRALRRDLAGVHRLYRETEALLQRELGAAPAPATLALYHRIVSASAEARVRAPRRRRPAASEDPEAEPFVGRHEELEAFRRWLVADGESPGVLVVHGPGGIGKSTLLRAFARLARELGWVTLPVDARELAGAPERLAEALGARSEARLVARLNRLHPLILLDTCEELGELGRYLRERFLPHLDPEVRLVMAGRYLPDAGWRLDSGWRGLVRALPLRTFTPAEAEAYLRQRGVRDPSLLRQLTLATAGNPLALSLAADLVLQLGVRDLRAAEAEWSLTVHDLVGQLLRDVRDPALRATLEVAAVLRSVDQAALAALLGTEVAAAAFEALARLSVVRPQARGLSLHADVRRLVADDLRWRDPARFRALRLRALVHLRGRLAETVDPEERAWLWNEWLFLSGHALVQAVLYGEAEPGRVWVEDGRPEDHPALRRLWRAWFEQHLRGTAPEVLHAALEAALRWPGLRLRVARGRDGAVLGWTGVVPVCRESLPILLAAPNSAGVLRTLWSDVELRALPATPDATRAFFFRYLVVGDREPEATRAVLLRDLVPLLSLSGTYCTSVADPEVQALVEVFGFARLHGVRWMHPGAPRPEQGYVLDLSEVGFERWVEGVVAGAPPPVGPNARPERT